MKRKENRVGTQVSNIRSWLDCHTVVSSLSLPVRCIPRLPIKLHTFASPAATAQLVVASLSSAASKFFNTNSNAVVVAATSTTAIDITYVVAIAIVVIVVVRRRRSSFVCRRSLVVVPLSFVVRRSSFLCRSSFVVPLSFVVRCSLLHHFTTQTPAPESSFRGHHHSPIFSVPLTCHNTLIICLRSASTRISK